MSTDMFCRDFRLSFAGKCRIATVFFLFLMNFIMIVFQRYVDSKDVFKQFQHLAT